MKLIPAVWFRADIREQNLFDGSCNLLAESSEKSYFLNSKLETLFTKLVSYLDVFQIGVVFLYSMIDKIKLLLLLVFFLSYVLAFGLE